MKDLEFEKRNRDLIKSMNSDQELKKLSRRWFDLAFSYEYSYHFTWLDRPIIQFPQDMITTQEIIWKIKPDLIIETGIARGGSIIFYASLLELIGKGTVIGIDIDIRKHNREEIERHKMYERIIMLQGSSTSKKIVNQVYKIAKNKRKVMLLLDSTHIENHVLKELELYSPLIKKGSYIVVFDTMVEDMPENSFPNKPWNKKNNPKTAVRKFLKKNDRFKIDKNIERKLLITSCPSGYLKCVK